MLTSWEQYRSEILNEPTLSDTEMQALAKQAGSGDEEAKELFVKQCLRFVIHDSYKYTQFIRNYDDRMDLISAANERVAEALDQALSKREPTPYIRAAIRYALIEQSAAYRKLVTQDISLEPLELNERFAAEMQRPAPVEEEHPKMPRVREALNSLTDKQRYVVLRHFGLDGDAPESLYALSKRMSSTGKDTHIADRRLKSAINRLQHLLEEEEHSSSPSSSARDAHEAQSGLAQTSQVTQQEPQVAFKETLEHYKDEIPGWLEAQKRLDTTVHEPLHDHHIGFDR